jgi:tRNA G37 N-methylase Trm5
MILLKEAPVEGQIEETLNGIGEYRLENIEKELNYKNFDNQQILNWFTKVSDPQEPSYVHFPGSFETIGHIAHYNLTEEQ